MAALERYLWECGIEGHWFSINYLPVPDLIYVLLWDGQSGKAYFPERGIEFDLVESSDRRVLVDHFIHLLNSRMGQTLA